MRAPAFLRPALAAAALLALASCNITDAESTVDARIQNASVYTLQGVTVHFAEGDVVFGDIAPGQLSASKRTGVAYTNEYIEATVQGQRMVQQPIDHTGDPVLERGSYTYVLTVSSPTDPNGLHSSLHRDK
ncbi:MAG TPA: hypothetical protein VFE05_08415 [Longimicrobiaceae bacterium]|jgi:hypothetical protein|nr:hypothetical protein [Longimicrobiaceae bacterium]